MRTIPTLLLFTPWLLLSPALSQADTYKCVIDGETVYSQVKCGANAEKVRAQDALSGVGQPLNAKGGGPIHTTPSSSNASAASAPPPARSGETPGVEEMQSDCQARLAAYQESLACFGRYRINANVMDPAAYKNCKVVAEPTDCLANGM